MYRFGMIVLVGLLAGLLAGSGAVFAQSSTGTLTGIVTDPSQARLANVVLKLTNRQTGVLLSATTTSAGEYTFPLIPSGTYRLEAEVSGFQRNTRSGIVMELGRTVRLDIALTLAAQATKEAV